MLSSYEIGVVLWDELVFFGFKGELHFILVFVNLFGLNIQIVTEVVDNGLFDHVWIPTGEELGFVGV